MRADFVIVDLPNFPFSHFGPGHSHRNLTSFEVQTPTENLEGTEGKVRQIFLFEKY
jgi:hypothetical protein